MSSSVKTVVQAYQNYINGQWVKSSSGEMFPVYDPSTEEVIAHVASGTAADVDSAVKAARAAFDAGPWPQTSAAERGRILYKLAEKILGNAAQLAEIECRNSGKPIVEAEHDIADAATCFEYYTGLANKVLDHVNPVPPNTLSFTLPEPLGAAPEIIPSTYPLVISPWNLPPLLLARSPSTLPPSY